MRSYSVAAAAVALDLPPKWLDNLLSQNRVAGVVQARQGVPRRLSPLALYVIATIRDMNDHLQVPIGSAVRVAHELWSSPIEGMSSQPRTTVPMGDLTIELDRDALRRRVDGEIADALEMTPRPRRGRPPRSHVRTRR